MKKLLSTFCYWWRLYCFKRYCRRLYRLERKMFLKYINDGKSASEAKLEAGRVSRYLQDIDDFWKEFI